MELILRGQRSAAVADLQSRLLQLGIDVEPTEIGGQFGPGTEQAVKHFQQQRGLHVDGIVGEATWREIVESSWNLGDRPLQLTDPYLRGGDIRELQTRLNALGFHAGKHDGILGPTTVQALKDFQRNLAIEEDGILGLDTVSALERLRLVTKPGLGGRITEREVRMADKPGLAGKHIVIDPGHGGDDPGEKGPGHQTEAELVFKIAARTAPMLDSRGAITVLTRGPYDGPTESHRAHLANQSSADLLVSIHLNSHKQSVAEGAATYYFEHSQVASEPGEHLARLIQQALAECGRLDCRSHGKSYPILRETRMPAVVVEPCFLTNPKELELLNNPESLDEIAGALVKAIEQYFAHD